MIGRALALLTAVALVMMLSGAAQAKRVALVVGNADYRSAPPLRNPVNDATRLSSELESLGFEVLTGIDLDVAGMREVVRDFSEAAEGADLALFFYAGHGLQVHGRNYLLPVDAVVGSEADLDFAALDIDLVLRQMNRGAAAKIVLLDACRNNPFEGPLMRSMGATRSAVALGRGLARIDAAGGSLIAFATEPGAVAADGDGRHSPFAQALLNHLDTPGLEINVLMTRVRAEVFASTRYAQRPWTNSSLIGEVYLVPEEPEPAAVPVAGKSQTPDAAVEIAFWTAAERSGDLSDYEAYLREYPDGAFVALARNRVARLQLSAVPDPDDSPEAAESGGVRLSAVRPTEAPAVSESAGEQPPTSEEVEQAMGLDRAKRREVQERLTILGFSTRGIDGIFGPGTRSAIHRWQVAAGLVATGHLSAEQLSRLERETDAELTAFRERRRREAEAAAEALRKRRETDAAAAVAPQQAISTQAPNKSRSYRVVATCGQARGIRFDFRLDNAKSLAIAECVRDGGNSTCCSRNYKIDEFN